MRRALAATALTLALLALACGGNDAPAPATAEPTASEAATATTAESPATTPTPSPSPTDTPAPAEAPEPELEIVTVLPPDAIPAIDDPAIVSAAAADEQLRANDLVIGVSIGGEHRAYGAAFLSAHEIVNDMLGGRAIAVTW